MSEFGGLRKRETDTAHRGEKMGRAVRWLLAFPGESSPKFQCIALGQENYIIYYCIIIQSRVCLSMSVKHCNHALGCWEVFVRYRNKTSFSQSVILEKGFFVLPLLLFSESRLRLKNNNFRNRRGQWVCVCVSVCAWVPHKRFLGNCWLVIIIKLGPVTAADMVMHHVLIILTLTFIQGHTALNHE